ncbi:flagellar hook protein FlgE [Planosporangium flavigriseum]|uniref:Flagellar hook protein FlgE n=1 Tax=Planosporangium flavigriseum TaxID=373681 RepID=A0A8J3LM42_9ACTN|nr:flagellar hook protein FlgE [Planosporangium flavigriseum]NJC66367.1 flagellar hook protein FlgE [Planosporangium flavigriseum]GIG74227.1 flagellar hook protein FlgE [Planosporangium flavigriseum]
MLRSLFSGISGLRVHQTMMDVTGNNISNVNTAGFKTSQSVFEDTLSQMLKAAGAPQNGAGGTNPAQVGLGVRLAGINTNFTQGGTQNTGRTTDLMINGDGFFVVRNGGEAMYTRSGAFNFDATGILAGPGGAVVQGWMADPTGAINTNAAVGDVKLAVGTLLAPTNTDNMTLGGNLPADSTTAGTTPITMSETVYDAQGNKVQLSVSFTKLSATSWSVTATDGTTPTAATTINFAADGSGPPAPTSISYTNAAFTAPGIAIDLTKLTSYAGASSVGIQSQNGSGIGSLQSFTISPDGTLVGVFSNGKKQALAQIAMATFNNPPGLEKTGGSMYRSTVNSGLAQLGTAGTGGRGGLQGSSLEMSNVDLAQEFTNLIIAQRGFQANTKVISTSDELLNDLVNLKR